MSSETFAVRTQISSSEAIGFAASIIAKSPKRDRYYYSAQECDRWDTDRERVASDLAGYLRALGGLVFLESDIRFDLRDKDYASLERTFAADRADRLKFLVQTGTLYGVFLPVRMPV